MKTLPMLARETGYSLDGLRQFVRDRPDLRVLGAKIGPTKAYSVDEAKVILDAWAARDAARAKAAATLTA